MLPVPAGNMKPNLVAWNDKDFYNFMLNIIIRFCNYLRLYSVAVS